MTATKQQLIQFICTTFADSEGNRPTKSDLDSYKKDDLIKVIADAGVESEFESFIASLN